MPTLGVYNQIIWPGVGDPDDCWVIASLWVLVATGTNTRANLPSVTAFRAAAGNIDVQGQTNGGSNAQIMQAFKRLAPNADVRAYNGTLSGFSADLKAGYIASLAVKSSLLPKYLQFGFKGLHQVSVISQGGRLYVMNPLAQMGSALLEISEIDLLRAAGGFSGDGKVHAVLMKAGAKTLATTPTKSTPLAAQPLATALPRDLNAPIVVRNYIHASDAVSFYRARHKPSALDK